jgi:DedD protein
MSDESQRDFQLNQLQGKPLVFLFMASVVVAVAIFLCGVMVGRGVRPAQATTASIGSAPDPTADTAPAPVPDVPPPASTEVPPTPPDPDEFPATRNLDGNGAAETSFTAVTPKDAKAVKPPAPAPTAAPAPAPVPAAVAPAAKPAPISKAPAAASPPEVRSTSVEPSAGASTGAGYVVQVVATPRRAEADTLKARLGRKAYPAFVTKVGAMYRVRVGPFKNRAEASAVATRLQKEEKFKPWVTR